MRRQGLGLLALAGLIGLAAAAEGQDADQSAKAATKSWLQRWFHDAPARDKKKSAADKGKADENLNERLARMRRRAQANYFRRMDVCISLRKIAMETKDEKLLKRVEAVENRIWEAFKRDVALDDNPNPPGVDEEILDKHLGRSEFKAPRATPPAQRAATDDAESNRAAPPKRQFASEHADSGAGLPVATPPVPTGRFTPAARQRTAGSQPLDRPIHDLSEGTAPAKGEDKR